MKKQLISIFLFCLAILPVVTLAAGPTAVAEVWQRANVKSTATDSAHITFRIGLGQSLSEDRFNELLDYFDDHAGVTDEITLFSSITHPPIPLDVFRERMKIFKIRMEQARDRGYSSGINILNTMGHHEENMDNALKGDYTRVTDIEGNENMGVFCPNDERYREEYVREIYKAATLARPDYIWIDDDVRVAGHGPLRYTCFCQHCLEIFSKESGKKYTRQSLKQALNQEDEAQKLELRKQWLQHNRNTIARLFTLIEQTVHDIDPSMTIGFMTGDRFFEGYDFANWADILSGKANVPVRWRPGGGAYTDNAPGDFISKAHAMGRQVSALPGEVAIIQSEIENFPYQRLRKSARMVAFEAALYIAAGCTGTAYNVLSFYDEPLHEYRPLAGTLQEVRPFLDLMVKHLGREPLEGVQIYWDKNLALAGNLDSGNWLEAAGSLPSYDLFDIGLPVTYSGEHASVYMLGKDMAQILPKARIEELLSGSVYMDAEALQVLNSRGFSDLTGFEVVATASTDRIERLTDHPLNGEFAGRLRDNRQTFYRAVAYTLERTAQDADILSELVDYDNDVVGECALGVFENRLGGRVAVSGYYPWTFMGNLSKNAQMKSVFNWLSRYTLPGYIDSFYNMNLWIRDRKDGKVALALSNSSFDPANEVALMLQTEHDKLLIYDMAGKSTVIKSVGKEGPYQKFVIPHVDPWEVRLVVSE